MPRDMFGVEGASRSKGTSPSSGLVQARYVIGHMVGVNTFLSGQETGNGYGFKSGNGFGNSTGDAIFFSHCEPQNLEPNRGQGDGWGGGNDDGYGNSLVNPCLAIDLIIGNGGGRADGNGNGNGSRRHL